MQELLHDLLQTTVSVHGRIGLVVHFMENLYDGLDY